MKYLWQYKNARKSAYIVLSELKLNTLKHRLKSIGLTWNRTWTWRQRLYVWRKTEYVRTKMSCFLLAKLNVVSLCYVMSCEKNQSFSFFSSILMELRPVQGVSWILRHDKTWKNSHQWYARSKQQNGTLGWSSCDVRTRISSNLIKHCRWEENYVKKFLLAGLNRWCNPTQHND